MCYDSVIQHMGNYQKNHVTKIIKKQANKKPLQLSYLSSTIKFNYCLEFLTFQHCSVHEQFHQTHTKLSKIAKILSCNIKYQIKKPDGGFPGGSGVKNQPADAGDRSLIPGWGRSTGEGNGNPFQFSCLENSVDRGAWWATVHGVTKSRTQVTMHTCILNHFDTFETINQK